MVVPLVLASCDDGNGETGANGSSTGEPTPAESSSSTTTGDDSTTEAPQVRPCEEEQVVPAEPDCAGADGVIDTSVIIEDNGDDPSILEGVVRVEGSIRINRIDAQNLDFMQCVQEVTGDVTIFGNENLTNVDGLWSLTDIGTDFIFSENTAITDFNGLPNVTRIPQNLIMKNNDSLETVSGFHQLVGIEGNLTIQNNDALMGIDGLGGLRLVGGVLAITANGLLCDSSIICVGEGITMPPVPPESWSTQGNNDEC